MRVVLADRNKGTLFNGSAYRRVQESGEMGVPPRIASDGLPEGWFGPDDAALYRSAVERIPFRGRIVEIGTWLGRSLTIILPRAITREAAVWCVDTWKGSENDLTSDLVRNGFNAFETFQANMRELKLWGTFTVIRDDQILAAHRFPDEYFDLVFIDADHAYEAVKRDISLWWPKLKRQGLMMGHDYSEYFPGVVCAVNEAFGGPQEQSGHVWLYKKG